MYSLCNNFFQDLIHRFRECLEEVGRVHHVVVFVVLAQWKQNQRLFSWEDDAGRNELNNIQRWFESLAELLWRLRQLGKQVYCIIIMYNHSCLVGCCSKSITYYSVSTK